MAKAATQSASAAMSDAGPDTADRRSRPTRVDADTAGGHAWSQVWQVPVLLLGAAMFAAGVWLARPVAETHNFSGKLNDVAVYLQAMNLEGAADALDTLDEFIHVDPDVSPGELAQYWQYRADLAYLQLQARTPVAIDTEISRETNRKIAGQYAQAEQLGRRLSGQSTRRYAETLVALGRDADALALVDRMIDDPPQRRYDIVRALIEKQRTRRTDRGMAAVMPLVERFKDEVRAEPDPKKRREQEIWAARLEATLQLEAGDPHRAIDFLLMRIQRFTSAGGDDDLAALLVLLAQAYQQVADLGSAQRLYAYAQQKLPRSDGLNAEILLGLGQITLMSSEDNAVQMALDYFSQAERNYPSEPTYVEALVGRADCEARLGAFPESIQHFRRAVEELVKRSPSWDERRQATTQVVRSHIDRALDQAEFELALDYLTLLTPLHQPNLPAPLLLDFAVIHENIAEQRKLHADRLTERLRRGERDVSDSARRLANQEAAMHFERAGSFFLRHARAVTILDNDSHGMSLWKAATSFDRAQAWREAIGVYAEFVQTRQNDARRLAAKQQLGRAYLADNQYEPAAELFLAIARDHPNSPEAFDSLVPLARAYLGLGKNDAAERVLLQVVTDHPAITPESMQYRQALVELGKLYYRMGEANGDHYVSAIERLEEAVQRYGLTDEGPTLRYLLADSMRKSVAALDRALAERQSQAERLALQAERNRRLEQAQMLYNQVISELESRPASTLSALEQVYRRNSYFYQADCAYDRRQFETAIQLYDNAARRFDQDPASLVALVQIVNAHCELGQYQQARVANETARWQLQRIPESAFDDDTLPMSRRHWEDWLRWTSELNLFAPQASVTPASNRR